MEKYLEINLDYVHKEIPYTLKETLNLKECPVCKRPLQSKKGNLMVLANYDNDKKIITEYQCIFCKTIFKRKLHRMN